MGYYYRRRRVQEKYDELYGVDCRVKRKILGKLKEGEEERLEVKASERSC